MTISNALFRGRVHRGTQQIGGSCIELEADGARILLDVGLPLDADGVSEELLPDVSGLQSDDPSLNAIVISHGHGDHWGLLPLCKPKIPLAMGAATARIMSAAAPFVPNFFVPEITFELIDRKLLQIGPFSITPYLVDHSAYDAYALTIEACGRRLFYSGDIRSHGRKGALFERLVNNPPTGIDTMLMEGSSLGRLDELAQFPTETEIETRLADAFRLPGFIMISASAQNIDRMVSIYRACKRTGRTLLLDLYAMEILRASGNSNLPNVGWPNLSIYVPEYQRRQIAKNKRFDLLQPYKSARIYREHLTDIADKTVMLFRPAMARDVEAAKLWDGARSIWSQWDGYLKEGPGAKLKADFAGRGIALDVLHTSGHASIADLKRLAKAINPATLIPIHTFEGDSFSKYFNNVTRRSDGEGWDV
ncbi:MBL fold metallo-hydrolase [Bradyrhizobium sp. 17]|uniref:MBL fold metallo-hydrolase n=1 Tax=Bradyrhizobium sp. 17 TaxID=2782649 RepID=UPI001FF7B893|nr:MBL fold metallo-hydrolase [Bradyrhizobium sp. 17]MCK1520463.1 MBL fold metallo-hydrolase [Bradyrhizobium sp. 17]